MDIFVINKEDFSSDYTASVKQYDKVIWVESYNHPGEVTIVGNPNPLMSQIPVGTWISHSMTKTIMVIENHVIEGSKLTATGRSIDAFIMDRRVVYGDGSWTAKRYSDGDMMVDLGYLTSWDAVRNLLNRAFKTPHFWQEEISNLYIGIEDDLNYYRDESNKTFILPKRFSVLSDAVYDILQSNDIGIRVERPNPERLGYSVLLNHDGDVENYGPLPDDGLLFNIHQGEDLTEQYDLTFSWAQGDLLEPRYLWTIQDHRDAVVAYTKKSAYFLESTDGTSAWQYWQTSLNCEDYTPADDEYYGDIQDRLLGRGLRHAEKTQGRYILTDAKVTKTAGPKYGLDYHLGDKVLVLGEYGLSQAMRVAECATISDKKGDEVIPTLANIYSTTYFNTCS